MDDHGNTGWYALYLSITQHVSPARAFLALESGRSGFKPLSWEEFVETYRRQEAKLAAEHRRRNSSEKAKAYQREYRRNHPLTPEQRQKRADYLRRYRLAKRTAMASHG